MKSVGVTASQNGLSLNQKAEFHRLLFEARPEEFHHGGCIGGDDQLQFAVYFWRENHNPGHWRCKLVMHRGDTPEKWANCDEFQDEIRKPEPNLKRNKDIVNETEELWAFPGEQTEQRRSGTWATIRYARDKKCSPVTVIYPDGSIERYNYG